jgi:ectoine hydroxylase
VSSQSMKHLLTKSERDAFNRDGFLVVPGALEPDHVDQLVTALDPIEAKYRQESGLKPYQELNRLDVLGEDDSLLELIDWPTTFPKVWGILGWHIALYHSHYISKPPLPRHYEKRRLGWHQDSGRLNVDIETEPRPRISLKVGFFLSDASQPDRGNFHVIPGSHLRNSIDFPDDPKQDHPDAVPVLVKPGDAVLFDRRIWHAGGQNCSEVTRKVLFFGYAYRWLKPRDDMTVEHYLARTEDPVRRQLLGASPNGGFGFTSPAEEDVPLKAWIRDHVGKDAVVP